MTHRGAATNRISSLEEAIAQCLNLGMRVSPQRRYILELLWQEQEHLSAKEIYHRLNQARQKYRLYFSLPESGSPMSESNYLEYLDQQRW